jgi:hypothetical protein
MRAIILAVLVAAGIGLAATPTVYAAPANGVSIGEDAAQNSNVTKAHWRGRSGWRRGWGGGGGCHYRYRSWGPC